MKELLHCYSVLDVHPSAEFEVIKSNYRRLAKKYHPDIYTGSKDEAERIMSDLNEAMRILSNKHLRHSYNAERPIKGSTFPDYEDFSEPGFESRMSDCVKKTNNLRKDANDQKKSKIYSNEKEIEKTFKKSCEFYPELDLLKQRLAKLSVSLSVAFMGRMLEGQEYAKAVIIFEQFRDKFLKKYFGSSPIVHLLAEYLFNKGTQRDRQTAMSLNKKIKSNGVPGDIKSFVRRFMKTHGIDELKVYGRKSKRP